MVLNGIPAQLALNMLMEGNRRFVLSGGIIGDYSKDRMAVTADKGQHPYAAIISCSDSRVVPEAIFLAGIGDLFVIRTAGNTICPGTVGSIEYAVDHLGCNLVVVLGHTSCGAVASALEDMHGDKVNVILEKVRQAAAGETDRLRVAELNAVQSVEEIRSGMDLHENVEIRAAMYDICDGSVRLL